MANITNHYAPGSCVFQAGSSMNGDVYITDCTINQAMPQDDGQEGNAITPNPAPRGPKNKFLFWLNGNEHEENVGVRNREKQRFLQYLAEHKMGGRSVTTTQGDAMNSIIVSFLIEWEKRGYISPQFGGAAVWRFLKNDCELQMEPTEKSYANKIRPWVKHKLCDAETLAKVEDFMRQSLAE